MKQLTKFGMLFAGAALLASCSNDNLDQPQVGGNVAEDGVSAVFTLELPAVGGGTRAIGADNFEQGAANEYKINSATFYVYKKDGSSEGDYICIAKSDPFYPKEGSGSNEIENRATVTIQIPGDEIQPGTTQSSGNYFGLAIINGHDVNTNFTEPSVGTSQKFSEWLNTVQGQTNANPFMYTNSGTTYFTMTNAPTFTGTPSDATITTLVPLDDSKFAKSPQVATQSAGTFYVQRGVAKVRIGLATTGDYKPSDFNNVESAVNDDHLVQLTAWALDVTNKKTYPVQKVAGLDWSKPYSYTTTTTGIEFNHLWWAVDPNYNSGDITGAGDDLITNHFTYIRNTDFASGGSAKTIQAIESTNPNFDYCLENTMNFDQMAQKNTTRVVFKGKYSLDGETFVSFIVNPKNDVAVAVNGITNIEITKTGSEQVGQTTRSYWKLSDVVKEEKLAEIAKELSMDVSGSGEVLYYENGETYYVARINHYDPTTEATLPVDWDGKLSSYKVDQLGRYGVLRNNIYDVKVARVLGYGSPDVPNPGDDPDDPKDPDRYNIMCTINVLKWAVRSYNYELK